MPKGAKPTPVEPLGQAGVAGLLGPRQQPLQVPPGQTNPVPQIGAGAKNVTPVAEAAMPQQRVHRFLEAVRQVADQTTREEPS